LTCRLP